MKISSAWCQMMIIDANSDFSDARSILFLLVSDSAQLWSLTSVHGDAPWVFLGRNYKTATDTEIIRKNAKCRTLVL